MSHGEENLVFGRQAMISESAVADNDSKDKEVGCRYGQQADVRTWDLHWNNLFTGTLVH